eukprot:GGOE01002585.1.p1 GENE.GGOE01002585.1~~GGOE01002585.1.p1  ORF type:complete len:329 (+),score=35.29 GGOE01002585.1:150-1136(+)
MRAQFCDAGVCRTCFRPLTGVDFSALDRKWFSDRLTCRGCHAPILTPQLSVQDGRPYHLHCLPHIDPAPQCAECVSRSLTMASRSRSPPSPSRGALVAGSVSHHTKRLGTDVCHGCARLIQEEVTTAAMGKTWHRDCFRCSKCARPIRENKFRSDGCEPLHINCKLADSVRICVGCYQLITGLDITEAMGELWHPDCFRCAICSLRICGSEFVRKGLRPAHVHCKRSADDRLRLFLPSPPRLMLNSTHDRDHTGSASPSPSCQRCKAPILGTHRRASGLSFHPACFLCGDCDLPIADDADCLVGSRPYHKRCIDSLKTTGTCAGEAES